MFQLTRLRLGILATQQPIYLPPHHYLIFEQQTFSECCQTYHYTIHFSLQWNWNIVNIDDLHRCQHVYRTSRILPVHGLGGVVLEPEDQGDVVLAAPGRHVARQHPRQPPQPGHPDDGHWNKWQLDIRHFIL